MTEKEIIEVISNSHLCELYTVLKEVYEENKYKTLINIDKELTLGDKNKVSYVIISDVKYSNLLDEVFYRIVETTDCKFPKNLPTGFSIYLNSRNRKNGKTTTTMGISLTINDSSVSFYFGYVERSTN